MHVKKNPYLCAVDGVIIKIEMNKIYFSIVIPLYNKQNAIAATLQSVLKQTYTNYEVIVVDDGSTDESANVAESTLSSFNFSDLAFRIIRKKNGGVCSARNRGIQEARYEYIALLDGDDQWHEDYLAEQVRLIKDFPKAQMWGINFAEMSHGKLVRTLPTGLPEGYRGYVKNYFRMHGRISDLFCSSSVVIRSEVFESVGYFDERLKYAEDLDMWFRIISTYPIVFYDKYLVQYLHDTENRALAKKIQLIDYLPFYVDKYESYKFNMLFYTWINRWAAHRIRVYYFSDYETHRRQAKDAAKKLDYSVLPRKYKYLFNRFPFWFANALNRIDVLYHKIVNM